MFSVPRVMLPLAVLALVATGCGDGAGAPTAARSASSTSSTAATPGTAGEPGTSAPTTATASTDVPEALRFTVAGVDGAQVVGADYAGKDVALWFWAPW